MNCLNSEMDKKQLIFKILDNQKYLIKIEKESTLDFMNKLNIKIHESSDGSRINLNRVSEDKLRAVNEYIMKIIRKNEIDDCYLQKND